MEIIATAGDDGVIIVWDIISGDIIETLRDHTSGISCMCFSPCGTLLVSGSEDGFFFFFEILIVI